MRTHTSSPLGGRAIHNGTFHALLLMMTSLAIDNSDPGGMVGGEAAVNQS